MVVVFLAEGEGVVAVFFDWVVEGSVCCCGCCVVCMWLLCVGDMCKMSEIVMIPV